MTYKNYWENYYTNHRKPTRPSPFAEYILNMIKNESGTLVELGCGNGRDALFFRKSTNLNIIALDQCENEVNYLSESYGDSKLRFISCDFTQFSPNLPLNYVYSRWTMHSINEKEENNTINWVYKSLTKDGLFFIEARSIRDELYGQGKKLGNNAYLTDHYRRFMIIEEFTDKLKKVGFKIQYKIESQGLAIYKEDDPFIIRIIAEKI